MFFTLQDFLNLNNSSIFLAISSSQNSNGDFKEFNQPILARKPELIYGLRNIIQNAIEFSKNTVWIDVTYNVKRLIIFISDDGSGYPSNLLKKIGEPFLNESNFKKNFENSRPHYEGMGLGLFISKTLLENLGANVTFNNEKINNYSYISGSVGTLGTKC